MNIYVWSYFNISIVTVEKEIMLLINKEYINIQKSSHIMFDLTIIYL